MKVLYIRIPAGMIVKTNVNEGRKSWAWAKTQNFPTKTESKRQAFDKKMPGVTESKSTKSAISLGTWLYSKKYNSL